MCFQLMLPRKTTHITILHHPPLSQCIIMTGNSVFIPCTTSQEICLFTWKKPNPVNTEKLKNLSLVSFIREFVMFSFFVLFKKFSVFSFLMKLGAMVQMVANIYFCVQGLNLSTFTLLMLYYNAAKRLETGSYWYQRLLF